MLRLFRVSGQSMMPLYHPADILIVFTAFRRLTCRSQKCIVFDDKHYGLLVKQVVDTQPTDGTVTVAGLNQHSIDSQMTLGPVCFENVVGRVLFRFPRNLAS